MLSPFHPSTTCCSPISLPLLYFYSSSSFISHNSSSACLNRYNISHIEKRVYSLFSCTSRNSSDSRLYDSLSSHCYSRDNSFWCPNHCILLSLPTNESSSCLGACLAVTDSVICFSWCDRYSIAFIPVWGDGYEGGKSCPSRKRTNWDLLMFVEKRTPRRWIEHLTLWSSVIRSPNWAILACFITYYWIFEELILFCSLRFKNSEQSRRWYIVLE